MNELNGLRRRRRPNGGQGEIITMIIHVDLIGIIG